MHSGYVRTGIFCVSLSSFRPLLGILKICLLSSKFKKNLIRFNIVRVANLLQELSSAFNIDVDLMQPVMLKIVHVMNS